MKDGQPREEGGQSVFTAQFFISYQGGKPLNPPKELLQACLFCAIMPEVDPW